MMKPTFKKFISSFVKSKGKTVFVTVGSTQFDKLIERIISDEVIKLFINQNVTKLIIQIGNCQDGTVLEKLITCKEKLVTGKDIDIDFYAYKPSISEDMDKADIIIGHAGAGTCLEALRKDKRLIVVVNDNLMDNHQTELAEELLEKNYALVASLEDVTFVDLLCKGFDEHQRFERFPPPNKEKFDSILSSKLQTLMSN